MIPLTSDFTLTLYPYPPGLPSLCQCYHHLPGGLLCSRDLLGWSCHCCFCECGPAELTSSKHSGWWLHTFCASPKPGQCLWFWLRPCLVPPTSVSLISEGPMAFVMPSLLLLPQVFGIILASVFAYDAFKIYQTEMAPRATQGECLCSGEKRHSFQPQPWLPHPDMPFPAPLHLHRGPAVTQELPGSWAQPDLLWLHYPQCHCPLPCPQRWILA